MRAGEQGYSVPAEAVNNANSRLLRYLQDPGMMSIRYSDDTRASKFAVGRMLRWCWRVSKSAARCAA